MAKKEKSGGGARKKGRNRRWCERYEARGQRERNKARKLIQHFKKYRNDLQAEKRLKSLISEEQLAEIHQRREKDADL